MHEKDETESFFRDPEFDLTAGLMLWSELQDQLAKYKELEMQARKAVFKKVTAAC